MEAAGIALASGDRATAEASLRSAITSVESRLDARDELSFALIKLGSLKQEMGNYAEAGEMFARALEICERVHGPTDPTVVPALTGVGTALILRGRPEVAQPLLARALNISETQLGEAHPDLAILLNDLSRLYMQQSAYVYAEPLLTRLLTIKRAKGEDHPEVATVLASLGTLHYALGRYETAEQTWRRVVAIRERTLAPSHFSIATALEHLAQTLAARGRNREALNCYQRAYTIRELGLGGGHANLLALRERIADLQLQAVEDSIDDAPTLSLRTSMAGRPSQPELPPALRFEMEPALQPPVRSRISSVATFLTKRRIAASIVIAILALPLLAWAVAGAARSRSQNSITPVALAASVTRGDSLRARNPTIPRSLATDTMRVGTSAALYQRPVSPARVSDTTNRTRLAGERSSSRPISVPTIAHATISQQGLTRIDSAIRAGEEPRVFGAEAFRDQLLRSDDRSPVKAGPDITVRARLIGEMPVPGYPPTLRAIGIKGRVIVHFDVDTMGRPVMNSFTVVESPHAALTEAVRKVIPDMRFEPARSGLGYTPTTDKVEMRFSFTRP